MANKAIEKRKSQQRQATLRIFITAAILVCINIITAKFHKGIDLTKEKRFTLTDATKRMLAGLDEQVVVNVYLKGSFPAGFQRLSEGVKEKLQSFKEYGGSKIIYRFIDPMEGKDESEKEGIAKELVKNGVQPMALNVKGSQNTSEQIIFPYALVQYKGKSQAVKLIENHYGMSPLEVLNYSESLLEYKLGSAIHNLQKPGKQGIAYIVGHGESFGPHTYDLLMTLSQYYNVDTLDLPSAYKISETAYSAIIINKPTEPFNDKEKFKIDQYIMHGGHVLWAIDQLYTPVDSLQKSGQFITMDYGLNLDDQLFKYGVRINYDLIEDITCNPVPLMSGTLENGQPQIELRPMPFFPVFIPTSQHPIVHNMDGIMGRFVSSIDTIATTLSRKTILLQSSEYSRVSASPVRVSLSMLRYNPDPRLYHKGFKAAAVLLEGQFGSIFQNRIAPGFLATLRDSLKYEYKPINEKPTSMIVISDGEMLQNGFSATKGPSELGYWEYTQNLFANKNFILNCLEYLTDPNSMLEARSKDVKLRLLDGKRVQEEKLKWQFINIALPVISVLIFASVYFFFRKRRYEVKG